VEWTWDDEKRLRTDTDFLSPDEAARLWDSMLLKVNGVK